MQVSVWAWALFGLFVLSALAADLGLFSRSRSDDREPMLGGAAVRSAAWIALSLGFGIVVLVLYGQQAALTYLTAYLLEKSLSIDNVFVFLIIFSELRIPPERQRSVLLWGVIGALVMRALLIGAGLFVLNRFHWVVYPFAALIILAAVRLLWGRQKEEELVKAACAVCTSWVARLIPITSRFHGNRFWVRHGGRLVATPLLVALIVVETTDIVFALDSVPAVFAVTRDPFLVYTSNIFAMLGLRSLYFLLAGVVEHFRFLRVGLAAILMFFGVRLLLSNVIEVPIGLSLGVIAAALGLSVMASIRWPARGLAGVSADDLLHSGPRHYSPKEEVGGPEMPQRCAHLADIQDVEPRTPEGCEECLAIGSDWVHLRLCLTCGHVGCCDQSPNRHGTKHFHQTKHPIMRSFEPGEDWGWCYVDQLEFEPAPRPS